MLSSALVAITIQAATISPDPAPSDSARTVRVAVAPDGKCTLRWQGATIDPDPFGKAIAGLEDKKMPIAIIGDTAVPYRCVGFVIYTLQAAGLNNVGFAVAPDGETAAPAKP